MDDIYINIKDYNPNKKRKILIVFDDMIADMISNKKCNPIVTELFTRENIYLVFITQSYFAVPKNIRINLTNYLVLKIQDKTELQQIAFNHSSDIDFQDFIKCVMQNHILVWLLILLLHQIVLHVSERIF